MILLPNLQKTIVVGAMLFVMVGSLLPLQAVQAVDGTLGGREVQSNVFTNPLPGNTDVRDVLVKVIQFLLGLVGLLALLALVWGGLSMIIGFGSEDKVAHAKKIIFWAIAGLVVAGLSYVIVRIVAQDLLGL